MNGKIAEIAKRIRTLWEIMEISEKEMATVTDHTVEEYRTSREERFSFTFLYKCAERFGVDLVELLTDEPPKLSFYTITRKGQESPLSAVQALSTYLSPICSRKKLRSPLS